MNAWLSALLIFGLLLLGQAPAAGQNQRRAARAAGCSDCGHHNTRRPRIRKSPSYSAAMRRLSILNENTRKIRQGIYQSLLKRDTAAALSGLKDLAAIHYKRNLTHGVSDGNWRHSKVGISPLEVAVIYLTVGRKKDGLYVLSKYKNEFENLPFLEPNKYRDSLYNYLCDKVSSDTSLFTGLTTVRNQTPTRRQILFAIAVTANLKWLIKRDAESDSSLLQRWKFTFGVVGRRPFSPTSRFFLTRFKQESVFNTSGVSINHEFGYTRYPFGRGNRQLGELFNAGVAADWVVDNFMVSGALGVHWGAIPDSAIMGDTTYRHPASFQGFYLRMGMRGFWSLGRYSRIGLGTNISLYAFWPEDNYIQDNNKTSHRDWAGTPVDFLGFVDVPIFSFRPIKRDKLRIVQFVRIEPYFQVLFINWKPNSTPLGFGCRISLPTNFIQL